MSARSIVALDGAKRLGAKILVAGGGRCNVTNSVVSVADFNGGSAHVVRRVLAAFPVKQTIGFFREIGVELHEEEDGKLFPDTNQARTVLNALLHEAGRRGVQVLTEHRVTEIARRDDGLIIATSGGPLAARRVVLATGGLSLPKTGSDGSGYRLAQQLGHSLVPTTPALVPLVLADDFHAALPGVSHDVELTIRVEGQHPVRMYGSLLWTHFGVSGPVVLNASRHWHRARLEGRLVDITASFLPGEDSAAAERRLLELSASRPKLAVHNALANWLPARVADAVLDKLNLDASIDLAHLTRPMRRTLAQALTAWPLPVQDSRGYGHAEVTAGGVPLREIDPARLVSRACPGLYLVGEILDVDGRIGGFNFQWAWSSAWVAATGLAADLAGEDVPSGA
jgi:predicted Rossmann fold flavoprotein